MSEPNAATDPVDKASVQAEALLNDDAERAARRARVLAAVAREPGTTESAAAPSRQRSPWRPGGWLAAACVAGFGLLLTARVYQPDRDHLPTPTAPAPATQNAKSPATAPQPAAPTFIPSPPDVRPASRAAGPPRAPPAPEAFAAAPPPAPPSALATPMVLPAPPPLLVPAPPGTTEIVVTGARIARRGPLPVMATRSAALGFAGSGTDPAARLRAAAADGRTAELEALLGQGVPVDAPDAGGTTALMKSIQTDQPAAAALLRRHGASLDQRDRTGVSARDMAAAKDDPALDQAIGVAVDADSTPPPRIGSQ